jgi:hypothetical protein
LAAKQQRGSAGYSVSASALAILAVGVNTRGHEQFHAPVGLNKAMLLSRNDWLRAMNRAWRFVGEKFRQWREDREYFLKHYHQRSNIETAIMMWKTSFGDSLRSKTEIDGDPSAQGARRRSAASRPRDGAEAEGYRSGA